jgi:hypothetical protein
MRRIMGFCLVAVLALGTVVLAGEAEEKVFLTSTEGRLVVDVHEGKLRVRSAKFAPDGNTYLVDGGFYPADWKTSKERRKKIDVTSRLSVSSDVLHIDGRAVELPDGLKMRNIWTAVLWKDWVLCLGRTSKTDRNAKEEPPFFATELIAFRATDLKTQVRYLIPSPPASNEMAFEILEARPLRK